MQREQNETNELDDVQVPEGQRIAKVVKTSTEYVFENDPDYVPEEPPARGERGCPPDCPPPRRGHR